jgi:uncharacterized cupredoxin-like copper-binding protein
MKKLAAIVSLAAALAVAGGAFAHHAFNMYDNSKYVPLSGTVKTYVWKNPHVMIDFVATAADGSADPWSIECSSPNIIGRHGWNSTSLKPGDKVNLVVHPMKDGSHIALMVKVTTPAGEVLKDKM